MKSPEKKAASSKLKPPCPAVKNRPLFSASQLGERGASMLEFAVIFPVIILVILFFFDISRYWQAKNALEHAANEGLNLFVTSPDAHYKGNSNSTLAAKYSTLYTSARTLIQNQAAAIALNAKGNPANVTVTDSIPATPERYASEPVQFTASAPFQGSVIPYSFTVRGSATGYVEVLRDRTMPVPEDCSGANAYAEFPGTIGTLCTCSELGEYAFKNISPGSTGSCSCSSANPNLGSIGLSLQSNGKCGCASGYEAVYGSDWNRLSGGSMTQAQAKANDNAEMLCCETGSTSVKCPTDQVRNTDAAGNYLCSCGCGSGATVGTNGYCQCDDPSITYRFHKAGESGCVKVCPATVCPKGTTPNPQTCKCDCPTDQKLNTNNACVCALTQDICVQRHGPLAKINNNYCTCSCIPGAAKSASGECQCASPAVANTVNGVTTCDCPSTMTYDGGLCKCGYGAKLSDGICKCEETRRTVDPTSKACYCDRTQALTPPLPDCSGTNLYDTWDCKSCICRSQAAKKITPTGGGQEYCVCPQPNVTGQNILPLKQYDDKVNSGSWCYCGGYDRWDQDCRGFEAKWDPSNNSCYCNFGGSCPQGRIREKDADGVAYCVRLINGCTVEGLTYIPATQSCLVSGNS